MTAKAGPLWVDRGTAFGFILAAAGLMTLAACNKSPEAAAIENAGDNAAMALDNQGEALENAADLATNESTEAALDNAADNAHAAADNVSDAADAKADAVDDAKKYAAGPRALRFQERAPLTGRPFSFADVFVAERRCALTWLAHRA